FFFFASRRRHTRYWRDWSSDVCSSDLVERLVQVETRQRTRQPLGQARERERARRVRRQLPAPHAEATEAAPRGQRTRHARGRVSRAKELAHGALEQRA